jgi:hypothetical protein
MGAWLKKIEKLAERLAAASRWNRPCAFIEDKSMTIDRWPNDPEGLQRLCFIASIVF